MSGDFKKWVNENRTAIIIFFVIVVVVIFIFVVGKKDKPKKKGLLPGEIGGEIPKNWYPDDIAAQLFDVIDGWDSWLKKETAATKTNSLNDNQIILVYNHWADEYAHKTSWGEEFGSLTQAVRDEVQTGPEWNKLEGTLERLKLP